MFVRLSHEYYAAWTGQQATERNWDFLEKTIDRLKIVYTMDDKDSKGRNKMEILFTHVTDELQAGSIQTNRYTNGNLAVQLMQEGEPYATLSTNVEGVTMDNDCFIAKNYSENEGLLDQFVESGLFEDTGRKVDSGFVCIPIYKFNG